MEMVEGEARCDQLIIDSTKTPTEALTSDARVVNTTVLELSSGNVGTDTATDGPERET